ncbi:MAG: hypothetical protein RIM99_14335 [Cyclobacteriaceae bacterium]
MATEKKDIVRLKSRLEQHLGWGEASEWHSSMFTELSEKIFSKCQVMLSAATLKRFFGVVNHEGSPSTSTLDALSQFMDYANWRDFKLASPGKRKGPIPKHIPRKTLYVTAGFFIALIMISLIGSKRAGDPEVLNAIPFSSRPVTNTYPNSVVFDFDLKGVNSDSLFIQQYWDPTKTMKINRTQKQATGIYYFPGYFRAKLVIEGEVIKEHDLFLRSDGWIGTLDYQPVPKYFDPIIGNKDNIGHPELLLPEIQELEKPIVTTFHYVNDLGNISGDNFTLKATIKVNWKEKWAVCQTTRIYILGTDGAMIIPFTKQGCSSDIALMLNDFYLNGKEHDLSAFGADLSQFTDVQIRVKKKTVTVSVEGVDVFEAKYEDTMGRFVGLRFRFLGAGEVESYSVLDQFDNEIAL